MLACPSLRRRQGCHGHPLHYALHPNTPPPHRNSAPPRRAIQGAGGRARHSVRAPDGQHRPNSRGFHAGGGAHGVTCPTFALREQPEKDYGSRQARKRRS
jgi:hypothetical protein